MLEVVKNSNVIGFKAASSICRPQDRGGDFGNSGCNQPFPKIVFTFNPGLKRQEGGNIIKKLIFHQHVISSSGRQLHYQPQLEAQGHQLDQVMCST